jgi:hypothetical protein
MNPSTSPAGVAVHDESELRRPGITALALSIRAAHPRRSASRVMAEAKSRYHAQQRGAGAARREVRDVVR